MKPVIGVIPLFDETRDSIWMLPGYLNGLSAAGAIPVILPLHLTQEEFLQLDSQINGYLFTGGHDVSPALYGETPISSCGVPCPQRDLLEKMIFWKAYEKNKPILGICRGIQLINVLMGGTLYQDLPSQNPSSSVEHHMTFPYDRTVHKVTIKKKSPLYSVFRKEHLQVNSYHHQGIHIVGKNLEVAAVAEDGLVEGIYDPKKNFLIGVQWHPEFIYQKDEDQLNLLKAFVKACGEK